MPRKRRIDGITNYSLRMKLVRQSKNKYNMPRFRMVVRFSNKHVQTQIVSSTLTGDKILESANSQELAN